MSKVIKKAAGILPIAAGFIPGVGPLAAGAIGAGSGLLSGGGLKGALLGGLGGAVGAGGLNNAIGGATGLAGSGLNTLTKGLGGAISGAGSGGLKGALLGGLAGAGGSMLTSGGFDDLGLGESSRLGAGGMGPATQGSGLLGALTRGINSIGGATSLGGGSALNTAATIGGGVNSYLAQENAKDDLLAQQARSEAALAPYLETGANAQQSLSDRLAAGFDIGDYQNDPSYQFALQKGQNSIDRSLGARGKMFSGEALKAASEYNTGLANQYYNDAFTRWLQENNAIGSLAGSGQNAANTLTGVYDNIGNAQANAGVAQSNLINGMLSGLTGAGASDIIGYDANGQPIYKKQPVV